MKTLRNIFLAAIAATISLYGQATPLLNANAAANPYKYIGTKAAVTAQPCNPQTGDLGFATDQSAGQNIYLCTAAPGTWTVLSIDGGSVTTGTVAAGRLPTTTTQSVINDTNGNAIISFSPTGSAATNIAVANNTTGLAPLITTTGGTNIGLDISSRGTGTVYLDTGVSARRQFGVIDTAGTIINRYTVTGAATTAPPLFGIDTTTDSNVGMTFAPKGTGAFNVTQSTNTGPGLSVVGVSAAVNGLLITPAATASTPVLSSAVSGADANSPIALTSNGTGTVDLATGNDARVQFRVKDTAGTIINRVTATGAATGAAPTFGIDTTTDSVVDITMTPKGSGGVLINPQATYTITQQGITDASLATGVVLVPAVTGHTVRVVHAEIQPIGGNAATCTDIRIGNASFANEVLKFLVSGTLVASTWYDEASPVAQVTSVGNAVTPFGTAFASGAGIGVYSSGSTCATATSFNAIVSYQVNF